MENALAHSRTRSALAVPLTWGGFAAGADAAGGECAARCRAGVTAAGCEDTAGTVSRRMRRCWSSSSAHLVEQLACISYEPVRPRLKNVVPTLRVDAMENEIRMILRQPFVLVGDG